MANIFEYSFMIRAFLVGGVLAIIIPLVGVYVVLRRMSMMGDALAHSSLAGVTAGLAFGFNPVLGAVVSTIFAGLFIESIRSRLPAYKEMSIGIITSLGVGLAGVLSGFVTNSTGFSSFLFGSIVAISDQELYFVLAVGALVLASVVFFYRELFLLSLDERGAQLLGVRSMIIGLIFTFLIALTVAVAARTVGTLIVASLMVVPVASAMALARSYFQTCIYSVVFGILASLIGLLLSFYLDLRPGATIVLVSIGLMILATFISRLRK